MKSDNTDQEFYKYVELGKKYISTDEVGRRIVIKLTSRLEKEILNFLQNQAHLKTEKNMVINKDINLKYVLKNEVVLLWAIGFASGLLNKNNV